MKQAWRKDPWRPPGQPPKPLRASSLMGRAAMRLELPKFACADELQERDEPAMHPCQLRSWGRGALGSGQQARQALAVHQALRTPYSVSTE